MNVRTFAFGAVVVAGVGTAALTATAGSRNENPGVLPPWSHAYGKTYAQWSAEWWRWALAIPNAVNPIEDPDGRYAATGQGGKVWFLAGTSGFPVTRSVTVPAGKAIFFPIINNVWVTIPDNPNYPGGDPPFSVPGAEQAARDALAAAPWGIDAADTLVCEVDGRPVTISSDHRVRSTVFTAYLPLDAWGMSSWIDHAGDYPDCVADGYWVMLAPLSKGHHTVHVRGANSQSGFATDFTFNVTVN